MKEVPEGGGRHSKMDLRHILRVGALFRAEMERFGLDLSNKKKTKSIRLLTAKISPIKVGDLDNRSIW